MKGLLFLLLFFLFFLFGFPSTYTRFLCEGFVIQTLKIGIIQHYGIGIITLYPATPAVT